MVHTGKVTGKICIRNMLIYLLIRVTLIMLSILLISLK